MIYIKPMGSSGKGEKFVPSAFTWALQDISKSDAGRTEDGLMHKNRMGQKRKLSVKFNAKNPSETSKILQAVDPEYIDVTYPDAKSGKNETRTFYVGDRTAPVHSWFIGGMIYTDISFEFIER